MKITDAEVGRCRVAALKYALELIIEREESLGLPMADASARPNYGGLGEALIKFVVTKADQIAAANGQ
jgi:hypothetical protein